MESRGYNIRKSFRMHMTDKITTHTETVIQYGHFERMIYQRIRLRASP